MTIERHFQNYDDLTPSAHDLSQGWRDMPVLPPATADLIVPFEYAAGRQPLKPRIEGPPGFVSEAVEELKDGHAVPMNVMLHFERKCDCGGKKHRKTCKLQRFCQHLVAEFLKEMEGRTHMKLAVAPLRCGEEPIILDDKDGLAPPVLRFILVPY